MNSCPISLILAIRVISAKKQHAQTKAEKAVSSVRKASKPVGSNLSHIDLQHKSPVLPKPKMKSNDPDEESELSSAEASSEEEYVPEVPIKKQLKKPSRSRKSTEAAADEETLAKQSVKRKKVLDEETETRAVQLLAQQSFDYKVVEVDKSHFQIFLSHD